MNNEEKTGIEVTLEYIKRDIQEIKEKMDKHYVTSEAFEPVKKLVYGLVTVTLTTGLIAAVTFMIHK